MYYNLFYNLKRKTENDEVAVTVEGNRLGQMSLSVVVIKTVGACRVDEDRDLVISQQTLSLVCCTGMSCFLHLTVAPASVEL